MWPFEFYTIPLDDWIQNAVMWIGDNMYGFFQVIKVPPQFVLENIRDFLQFLPPVVLVAIVFIIAWRTKGLLFATLSVLAFVFVGFLGLWEPMMVTLALIITASVFCVLVGIPLGILAARSERFESAIRPILDAMQTIPAFVYLVPIVMLFGVGLVPGLIATIVFALPPIIRLTNLGIRQVSKEVVEAGYAFGGTPSQILFTIQMPLAMPSIMAGLNQTLMLAISMVVISALIGAGGLGEVVWVGLGRMDVGYAAIGGVGIVTLAIILDRISQSFGQQPEAGRTSWIDRIKGFFRSRFSKTKST